MSNRSLSSRRRPQSLSAAELVLILVVAGVLVVAAMLSSTPKPADIPTTTVTVQNGDTLWTIAQRFPVPGLTTGQAVEVLSDLNELDGSHIAAGSTLVVPAPPAAETVAMR